MTIGLIRKKWAVYNPTQKRLLTMFLLKDRISLLNHYFKLTGLPIVEKTHNEMMSNPWEYAVKNKDWGDMVSFFNKEVVTNVDRKDEEVL